MEINRIFGRIFLPETPGKEIEAWLTISEKQILLEASITASRIEQWPLILGKFNGIDRITFVNCHASDGVSVGAGGSYRRIRVSYCIKMLHVNDPSELKFSKVTLLAPALSAWIHEKEWIEEVKDNLYKIPDHEEVLNVELDNVTVIVNNSHSIRHSDRELHIKKVCTVLLQSKCPIDINDFANIWRHLKKMILFLTNKNPEFDKIFLYTDDNNEFELINVKDEIKDDRFSQSIDISFHHVSGSFKTVVSNWFGQKKLQAIIDLVLEKSLNTQLSAQGFFLNVCVALETFNDHFLEIDMEEANARFAKREEIIKLIQNEDLCQWFKEHSANWKNPTLRERLSTYRTTIEFIMGKVFEGKFETDTFIGSIVKTRNNIAHTGEYLKRFTYYELFLASKIIEYTIRLEILNLLGVGINGGNRSLLKEAQNNLETLAYLNNYNQKATKK